MRLSAPSRSSGRKRFSRKACPTASASAGRRSRRRHLTCPPWATASTRWRGEAFYRHYLAPRWSARRVQVKAAELLGARSFRHYVKKYNLR
jgi:hypothetical protein